MQTRTLESAYALELAKRQTAALRRAVDVYCTASLFVSARSVGWTVMHMNDVALRLAGAHALPGVPGSRVRCTGLFSVHALGLLPGCSLRARCLPG